MYSSRSSSRIRMPILPPWSLAAALILKGAGMAGVAGMVGACGISIPKVVRAPVSQEQLLLANDTAKEADVHFARKDYYAALIKYLEASRLNPNSPYIFNKVGITYTKLDLYEEARVAFRQSIGLDSKYAYPYNNLGSVHFAQNDLRGAEKLFRKAIALDDKVASFHLNLGTLLYERRKFKKGLAEWRRGLQLDPEIFDQSEGVSLVAAGSGRPPTEKSYYVARLYASVGDVERALSSLRRALNGGFEDIAAIEKEPDFDPIREDRRFIAFMQQASLLADP